MSAVAQGVSLLRVDSVLARIGIKKTTLYRWIALGTMPPGIALGTSDNAPIAWPSDEIDTIVGALIGGQSEEERRATVRDLIAARSTRGRRMTFN
ncbi:MAG: AlpA family phage regulatory protein [Betaproteobacteria bacterium]|nr:AlpA family phage regulatory protein [Betaproteobacteria bacterium]